MKSVSYLPLIAVLVLAGCGGDGGSESGGGGEGSATKNAAQDAAAGSTTSTKGEAAGTGTTVTLADSQFGRILYDSKKQAIYIFERDKENESKCYGDCAAAWPPVFTNGEPRAGKGIDRSVLGTTRRRDGKLQVTYAGKPLYYYAHEGPGEVKCHNVNLNGGYWWVIGPNGERRP
jgi:predicted lipoprotein with Yx(FWY)xxD motif